MSVFKPDFIDDELVDEVLPDEFPLTIQLDEEENQSVQALLKRLYTHLGVRSLEENEIESFLTGELSYQLALRYQKLLDEYEIARDLITPASASAKARLVNLEQMAGQYPSYDDFRPEVEDVTVLNDIIDRFSRYDSLFNIRYPNGKDTQIPPVLTSVIYAPGLHVINLTFKRS